MKQKIFRLVADLRFSIFILLLISLFSILGTIIEQDQSIETYKLNYPLTKPIFGFLTWDRIIRFGLDHVYQTSWFYLLIVFFGLSLIVCTFLQQLPSLKIARRCQFFRKTNQFYRLKIFTIIKYFSFTQILVSIKKNHYSIFQQKDIVYCYKGLIGCLAPILVHLSIILVLIGAIVGSSIGFKAQEIVPKTENFHIQNVLNIGQLAFIPQTSARVNDFWITYKKSSTISQFYSNISILTTQGNEITQKTVSVNFPLIYDNIYYYQTDWNLNGLRLKTPNKEILEYPLLSIFNNQNKIWLTWISKNNFSNEGILIFVNSLEGYCSIYNKTGQFINNLELNETIFDKHSYSFLEIISSTGLQIKTDPGLPIIYIGFFFLMISTLLSYITYSQIWITRKNKQLFIGGTTNRALFEFELEFFKCIK